MTDTLAEKQHEEHIQQTRNNGSGGRRVLGRSLLASVLALLTYSALIEPRMIEFSEHEVPVASLPPSFEGLKIVQLSDLHVGGFTKPAGLRRVVDRVNAIDPDIVMLTGDIVDAHAHDIKPAAEELSRLRSRHGVYVVLGSHDYYASGPLSTKAYSEAGFHVLTNAMHAITIGEEHLPIVGLDDPWRGKRDYDKAFTGLAADSPCIALAHNPDVVLKMKNRRIDLLMTGHTHGGQIHVPLIGPVVTLTRLGLKYATGMFQYGDIRLFVSRGAGSGTPFRFRCRPEIPVFTLRRAD